jgi:hypothetical protein
MGNLSKSHLKKSRKIEHIVVTISRKKNLKNLGVVTHSSNTNTQGAKAEQLRIQGQLVLYSKLEASVTM